MAMAAVIRRRAGRVTLGTIDSHAIARTVNTDARRSGPPTWSRSDSGIATQSGATTSFGRKAFKASMSASMPIAMVDVHSGTREVNPFVGPEPEPLDSRKVEASVFGISNIIKTGV
jgi:hypothetical protein